jgi:hypothetical protein
MTHFLSHDSYLPTHGCERPRKQAGHSDRTRPCYSNVRKFLPRAPSTRATQT